MTLSEIQGLAVEGATKDLASWVNSLLKDAADSGSLPVDQAVLDEYLTKRIRERLGALAEQCTERLRREAAYKISRLAIRCGDKAEAG